MGESFSPKRKATVKQGNNFFVTPGFFDKQPTPMPGVCEYALVDDLYSDYVGIDPITGFPTDTLIDVSVQRPHWQKLPEYQSLYTYCLNLRELHGREIYSQKELVRQKLVEHQITGHSVTSFDSNMESKIASLYDIMRFGLWPESQEGRRRSIPWLDSFEQSPFHTFAGDYFNDFAIIPHSGPLSFVEIEGGGSFVPPLEFTIIVPNEMIKNGLIDLYENDHFVKHNPQIIEKLKNNIITFDDILNDDSCLNVQKWTPQP